jgi:hypothetical protein
MVKFVKGALLAAVASFVLAGVSMASHDADISDAELKCQLAGSKSAGKFVGGKSKCASKCMANFWKGLNPDTDCLAPYGGATAQCINDTVLGLKGVENKFGAAIKKACDPGTKAGTDCPECYSGGDCSDAGYATDQVQNIEGQVDSFGPGVFCERAGATKEEQKCQLNTAKVLSKLVAGVNKCYEKCVANAHKGIGTLAACLPPASDAVTTACINKADTKAIAGVDKLCSGKLLTTGDPTASPDCPGVDQYPSGAQWVNLVETAISGNVPSTFCGSPSGAFID